MNRFVYRENNWFEEYKAFWRRYWQDRQVLMLGFLIGFASAIIITR